MKRVMEAKFDFNDFLKQWQTMNNMGGIQMLKLMPGFNKVGGRKGEVGRWGDSSHSTVAVWWCEGWLAGWLGVGPGRRACRPQRWQGSCTGWWVAAVHSHLHS